MDTMNPPTEPLRVGLLKDQDREVLGHKQWNIDFRILGLAGSLRRASFHRGIVRAAHEVAPEWMSCESFDLARIPYFNQDVEDQGTPSPWRSLGRRYVPTRPCS